MSMSGDLLVSRWRSFAKADDQGDEELASSPAAKPGKGGAGHIPRESNAEISSDLVGGFD